MDIPAQSLYYLLCYAWNRLEAKHLADAQAAAAACPQDLFAHLLREVFSQLLRQGLDRGYIEHTEDTRKPRGKLDLTSSIRRALRARGQVHVRYEELSRDVLHNRIIKTTMCRLATDPQLNSCLKGDIGRLTRRVPEVAVIELRDELFHRVQIHRNNAAYGFLLDLCQLITRHLLPEKKHPGRFRFRDFTGDDREMGRLFEAFVRNFLSIEQQDLGVHEGHKQIKWDTSPQVCTIPIPNMETDIFVPNVCGRSVIIETKCKCKPFHQGRDGKQRLDRNDLYQIFAYLKNHASKQGPDQLPALGVLLYATMDKSFSYRYRVHDHPLWVRSLDLEKPWQEISKDMYQFVAELKTQAAEAAA